MPEMTAEYKAHIDQLWRADRAQAVEELRQFLAANRESHPLPGSGICSSGKMCGMCRSQEKGLAFRQLLCHAYKVGGDYPNFPCPLGKPWGYVPPAPVQRQTAATPPTTAAKSPMTGEEQALDLALQRGLGDEIHAVAVQIGAEKLAQIWQKWTGKDCGCQGRINWLNARWPGGWRQLLGVRSES